MWDYGLPHNPVAATEKFKAVVLAYEALAALNEADALSMSNGCSSWKVGEDDDPSFSRNVGVCAQGTKLAEVKVVDEELAEVTDEELAR